MLLSHFRKKHVDKLVWMQRNSNYIPIAIRSPLYCLIYTNVYVHSFHHLISYAIVKVCIQLTTFKSIKRKELLVLLFFQCLIKRRKNCDHVHFNSETSSLIQFIPIDEMIKKKMKSASSLSFLKDIHNIS